MKKNGLIFIFLFIAGLYLDAQQLPLLSQYMLNGFLVNPAAAGVDGYTSVTLTAREQWLGMAESPKTHIIAFQSRILRKSSISRNRSVWRKFVRKSTSGRVGIGGFIYNDKNGIIDRTGGQFTYAYHLRTKSGQLSLGLSAHLYQYSISRKDIFLENDRDRLLNSNDLTMYVPDFSFGMYYSGKNFYTGFSASQLTQSSLQLSGNNNSDFRTYRQYSLTSAYNFEINNDFSITPSVYLKLTQQMVAQAELSAKAYYKELYYGGISYRTGSAIILLGGVTVHKFTFGYAFDYSLNSIQKYNYGSHEFMTSVKFGDNKRRYRWINRY